MQTLFRVFVCCRVLFRLFQICNQTQKLNRGVLFGKLFCNENFPDSLLHRIWDMHEFSHDTKPNFEHSSFTQKYSLKRSYPTQQTHHYYGSKFYYQGVVCFFIFKKRFFIYKMTHLFFMCENRTYWKYKKSILKRE